MTPRIPEESPEQDEQSKALQAIHEAPGERADTAAASLQPNMPPLKTRPEETLDPKVEADRLELYLKGPTVFSA